jgi:glycosyltransferase involved in cell wall biosynthesis
MLLALTKEQGVEHRVHFAGYQGETRPYYELMDVFALASAYEAFGLVLVEAMFAGLPIVATRVGGIPTVVAEDETGYLVAPRSPPALAARLIELALDPAMRHAMGTKGRARARAEFRAERYVRDVDSLYQRLARARGLI